MELPERQALRVHLGLLIYGIARVYDRKTDNVLTNAKAILHECRYPEDLFKEVEP